MAYLLSKNQDNTGDILCQVHIRQKLFWRSRETADEEVDGKECGDNEGYP